MAPGDFASVPPGVIHNPKTLGPHTETFGLITPADWIDFFRYVGEPFDGVLCPEFDERSLREAVMAKMKNATRDYDVSFHPKHQGCEVGEWSSSDETLPESTVPYYLRANTGPRWLLGGVLSRPFITTQQSDGKFAISSIESSAKHEPSVLSQQLRFPKVHHCLCVLEGALKVSLGDGASSTIREGETVFIAANISFSLQFRSKFVRLWSFTSGDGIESLVQEAGTPFKGYVLPDQAETVDQSKVQAACEKLNIVVS
ncbi:hypothetical protein H2201_003195 [Coniosporium apollinis]|uniref:Cupin 2 conserved barrel domain-containing protein n=2 Tax=Coniosporium TaxID=2810619 RepID=A0ABQ9NYK8_9PEZI|nr:hypothetical protein H2199_008539 [Cladosporium sp. JES 115]KAJ9666791.1 hypothetical protein H2201_003195 [Coniosporium apollinis]